MDVYEATWIRLKVMLQGGIDACDDRAASTPEGDPERRIALIRAGVLQVVSREMDVLLQETRKRIEERGIYPSAYDTLVALQRSPQSGACIGCGQYYAHRRNCAVVAVLGKDAQGFERYGFEADEPLDDWDTDDSAELWRRTLSKWEREDEKEKGGQ